VHQVHQSNSLNVLAWRRGSSAELNLLGAGVALFEVGAQFNALLDQVFLPLIEHRHYDVPRQVHLGLLNEVQSNVRKILF